MKKITLLAINYKKTKNQKILVELLDKLEPLIHKKAKYIYYRKWYPRNYFHKCKYCQHCKNKDREVCQDCAKCLCDKGYFNLNKNNLCDFTDVKDDLMLKVLELIEQFDVDKDFYTFFGAVLYEWRPSFITQSFIKNVSHGKIYEEIEGDEVEINLEDTQGKTSNSNLTLDAIFDSCETDSEKEICAAFLSNPNISQGELASKLGMTQQNISLIINKLRKNLKKYL